MPILRATSTFLLRRVIAPILAILFVSSIMWLPLLVLASEYGWDRLPGVLFEIGIAFVSVLLVGIGVMLLGKLGYHTAALFGYERQFKIIYIGTVAICLFGYLAWTGPSGGCPPGAYGDYVCNR